MQDGVVNIKLKKDFKDIDGRSFNEIKGQIEQLISHIGGGTISLTETSSGGIGGGGGQDMGGMGAIGALMGFGNNQERIVIKGEDYSLLQRVGQDLLYYVQNLSETRLERPFC